MLNSSFAPVPHALGFKYPAAAVLSPAGAIATATAHTVGTLRLAPVHISFDQTISGLRHGVTVAGTAGALIDLVVYDSDAADGLPGSLVASKLGVDGTVVAATGATAALAANVKLKAGVYWVGSLSRVAAATQLSITPANGNAFIGAQASTWAAVAAENVATAVVAAIPSGKPTTVWATGIAPRVGLVFA